MTTIKNKKQTPFATGVYYANGDKTIKEKQIRQALPIFPENEKYDIEFVANEVLRLVKEL